MGGIGWHNPLPFEIGGGETDAELLWMAMRSAVGEGGPGPEDGLEDRWRQIKAVALAASEASMERAFLQHVPGFQTDSLEAEEERLGIEPASTITERQDAVREALTAALRVDIPSLRADLQRIDPAFDVEPVAYAQATVSLFGKAFGPRVGGAPYGTGVKSGVNATGWPNYATDFVVHVRYTIPGGGPAVPPEETLARVRRHLCAALPAHVDFVIYNATGFYLDGGADGTSLLDITAFG